jgi:transcription initiation factor IIE alpha subunit
MKKLTDDEIKHIFLNLGKAVRRHLYKVYTETIKNYEKGVKAMERVK